MNVGLFPLGHSENETTMEESVYPQRSLMSAVLGDNRDAPEVEARFAGVVTRAIRVAAIGPTTPDLNAQRRGGQ